MAAPTLTSSTPDTIPALATKSRIVHLVLAGTGFDIPNATVNVPAGYSIANMAVQSAIAATVDMTIPDDWEAGTIEITFQTDDGESDPLELTLTEALGILYNTSMDLLDDDGCAIRRERWAPVIINERNRIFQSRLRVDLQTGISEDPDLDPQLVLQYSDDAGLTWSQELQRSVGAIGQLNKPVEFWRLGQGRSRIYRLVMSDKYPWRLADAYLLANEGIS